MATYAIREKLLNFYWFEIDDVLFLENRRNDLTVDYTLDAIGYCHFKTSEGAAIFKYQNLIPTDFTIYNLAGTAFNPTTVDELKGYLDDIGFFDWQSNYGGGGGGGADRFDELEDTFNYPGKQGFVPVVNSSETGLAATYLYNKRFLTQMDDVSIAALTGLAIGKKVGVQSVGGNPRFVLVDDTSNVPIPPNALLNDFTPSNVGDEWTVPSGRLWRVDGILYSNPFDFVQEIPPAATGMIRQDIFYVTSDDNIHYLAGAEGPITAPVPLTPTPANSITAITFTVTDTSTIAIPAPGGDPWITKESYGSLYIEELTGDVNLPRSNKSVYVIKGAGSIAGLTTVTVAPDNDPNYANQPVYIRNVSGGTVSLKHQAVPGDIKLWVPTLSDVNLLNNYTAQFLYNKDDNRYELLSIFATDSGGSSSFPLSNTSPILIGKGYNAGVANALPTAELGDYFYWAIDEANIYTLLKWMSGDGTVIEDYEILASYGPTPITP